MPNRLLETDGTISCVDNDWLSTALEISGDTEADELSDTMLTASTLVVKFASSADGRGFSLAASLRESDLYEGKLVASGQLNPDQLSSAFQCGFDAILVDEAQWIHYGENAWNSALNPAVSRSYLQSRWQRLDSIWEHRPSTSQINR